MKPGECPNCGCMDLHRLKAGSWWGDASVKCVCKHCGHSFYETEQQDAETKTQEQPPTVRYQVLTCSQCGSPMKVRGTESKLKQQGIRRVRCTNCDHSVKIGEENVPV